MKTFLRRFLFVWNAQKIWAQPKRAPVLIFDRCGSDNFFFYLDEQNVSILDVRGESFNLYILLKCLLTFRISQKYYYAFYINSVQPKVVMTFIDNNWQFYSLKKLCPTITTVLVQNGLRANLTEQFESEISKNYIVDFMFLFNKNIGAIYSKNLKGKIFGSGSFLNNYHSVSNQNKDKSILFISQYRPKNDSGVFLFVNGRSISYDEFYLTEEFLLNKLSVYCDQNGFRFVVKASNSEDIEDQYKFFKERIGNENFDFLTKDNIVNTYDAIDQAQIIVGVDSTLVYESIARGNKTAFFTLRSAFDPSRKFAWPTDYPESGPFWTTKMEVSEFERVINYITQVSDEDWETTRLKYVRDLMEYDPDNSQFLYLMKELNILLKENIRR
ncbi:LA_1612 family putative O-antigen biosynthesis protein [Leptospira kirschneri]|uniref:LA_1612 family putative O-antigen biosynthesis protein n=1 Tax=Leptospira kirschneri TaxID=29507 RepID=UPI00046C88D3|nr:LA_1612 family putative O-antigen biosynthesis protein [Leptospira kirschneri]